ncbi:MAG: carboxymuconolactone decarboxylase family protein [Thermoleophilaceae bacterium]|jgi:4-carboxymuconolactone decarboxylase
MSRLPYVEPSDAPEHVREALDRLPPLNIFKLVANAETCFRPFLRLGNAILTKQELDPLLRELAILQTAKLTPAEYEWIQHVGIAKAVGATDEQVEAIDRGDVDAECFSDDQKLVLEFTTQVVRDARPSDELFARTHERLSPREIVELTLAIGYYMAIARVMEVADIDLDEPLGGTLVERR